MQSNLTGFKAGAVKGLDVMTLGWLWLTILLTPLIAMAGGLGFQVAGFLMGLSAVFVCILDGKGAGYLKSFWPIGLIAFVIWAWVSMLWSHYDADVFGGNASILFVLALTLLFVPLAFIRLSERMKSAVSWVVIIGGCLGVALIFMDAASGYAISMWVDPVDIGGDPIRRRGDAEMNLGRGQISYTQLAWPIVALMIVRLKQGILLAVGFLLALAVSAYLNDLSIVAPALAFSAGFAALAWWRPRLGLILAFAFAIISLIFAPVLGLVSALVDTDVMRQLPLSWEHRLRMWSYSWDLIQQAPLIGHGFDSARVFDALTFRAPDGRDITVISMHPHNIGLQIWLETGIVGICLAVAFLFGVLKSVLNKGFDPLRAMTISGLVSASVICGAASIGVWQHWWWALIMLTISFVILLPHEPKMTSQLSDVE